MPLTPQDAFEAELLGVADLEQQLADARRDIVTLRRVAVDLAAERDRAAHRATVAEARAEAAEERCRELCGGGAFA